MDNITRTNNDTCLVAEVATSTANPPVFVIETPSFMGLPTDDGEQRCQAYKGERKLDVPMRPCYVHGQLEDRLGYDIAMFARGHIRDVDEQDATVIDVNGIEHQCMILSVRLPHVDKPTRAAFIIDPVEKETVRSYLESKVDGTSKTSPRPML